MPIGGSPSLDALDVEYRWNGGTGGPIPISDFYRGGGWVTSSQTSVPTSGQINLGAFISTFSGHVETNTISFYDLGAGYTAMGMYFSLGAFNMMATTNPNAGGYINPTPLAFWSYYYNNVIQTTVFSVYGGDSPSGFYNSDYRISSVGFPWWSSVRSTYGESFGYGGTLTRSSTGDPNGYYSFNIKQSPPELAYWEWPGLLFFYYFMNGAGTAVYAYKN